MQKIDSESSLRVAILRLENEQVAKEKLLKEQFHATYESIKPINLIKSTFKEVAASPEVQDRVLSTSVGLAAGYISEKIFESVSNGPLRKLLGTALMFGITTVVAKNPEAVKSVGKGLLKLIVVSTKANRR